MKAHEMNNDELKVEIANCRDEHWQQRLLWEVYERWSRIYPLIDDEAKRLKIVGTLNA